MMYGFCEFCAVKYGLSARLKLNSPLCTVSTGDPTTVPPTPSCDCQEGSGLAVVNVAVGVAVATLLIQDAAFAVYVSSSDSALNLNPTSETHAPENCRA